MNYLKILTYFLSLSLLFACQSRLLTVYKINIQQGNSLESEAVDKVKIGMSREQVHYVLGTPLITDSFHPDRWDYIYLFIPGYGEQERRQLIITFDRDEVININRHNIIKSDVASTSRVDEKDKGDKEQEELEKQVDTLQGILKENKNPNK
jgi:outer membrane protein assembly factor BamE